MQTDRWPVSRNFQSPPDVTDHLSKARPPVTDELLVAASSWIEPLPTPWLPVTVPPMSVVLELPWTPPVHPASLKRMAVMFAVTPLGWTVQPTLPSVNACRVTPEISPLATTA